MANQTLDDFPSFYVPGAPPTDASGQPAEGAPAPPAAKSANNIDTVMRIPIAVKVVLGSATMPVSKLVKLGRGAVIPLDRKVGEAVDLVVNGHIIARGEVVIVDEQDQRFGISLTEIIGAAKP